MSYEDEGDIDSLLAEFEITVPDLGRRREGVVGTELRIEMDEELQPDVVLTNGGGQVVAKIPGWHP